MSVRREGGDISRLTAALASLDGLQGKTGFFETAHYPNGTPVAYVATIHEFGSPAQGIPPRPFMRPTVAKHGKEWTAAIGRGAKAILEGTQTPHGVLQAVTMLAAGQVAETIAALTTPPLAPATIAAKGSSKPLIDTGQMFQAVTGVVERA